jgi:hypothetical protein
MNKFRLIAASVVCAGLLAAAGAEPAPATELSKAQVTTPSVKKQVNVPKPKTNWSKIKDLFM